MPINFKFVSAGQALADAANFPQTLRGNSLKPLAPVSLRGTRDSDGDLLVEWARRSRLSPGLRPGSGSPLAEEQEKYAVEVRSADGSTRKRIWYVTVGEWMNAVMEGDSLVGKYDRITHNTLEGTAWPAIYQAATIQKIDETGTFIGAALPNNFIGATLVSAQTDTPESWLGLIDANVEWRRQYLTHDSFPSIYNSAYLVSLTYNYGLQIYDHGTLVYTDATVTTSALVYIELTSVGARFYKGYVGPGAYAIYTSPIAPTFPYRGFASVRGISDVEGIIMTTKPNPKTIYTTEQQTEDFGSIQSSVRVRIYQVSSIVGLGAYTEAIL